MTRQLDPVIPVEITAKTLPSGVTAKSKRGWCYAWDRCGIDGHRIWVVVLDETGEVVDVPQPEIRVDMNWSYGRREAPPRTSPHAHTGDAYIPHGAEIRPR